MNPNLRFQSPSRLSPHHASGFTHTPREPLTRRPTWNPDFTPVRPSAFQFDLVSVSTRTHQSRPTALMSVGAMSRKLTSGRCSSPAKDTKFWTLMKNSPRDSRHTGAVTGPATHLPPPRSLSLAVGTMSPLPATQTKRRE